jgi:hypothetical protein
MTSTNSSHDIGGIYRIGFLLEMLLPSNNIILEQLLILIVYLVLVVALRLRASYVLHVYGVADRWRPREVLREGNVLQAI